MNVRLSPGLTQDLEKQGVSQGLVERKFPDLIRDLEEFESEWKKYREPSQALEWYGAIPVDSIQGLEMFERVRYN